MEEGASSPTIVYVSDDNYAVLLGCSIRSLILHASCFLRVIILDCGLSQLSQSMLKEMETEKWVLSVLKVDDSTLPLVTGMQKHVSKATWAKILIPTLLTGCHVLYLDCDTLIRADVAVLWQQGIRTMDGTAIGAVRDFGLPFGHSGMSDLCDWGCDDNYFNAGVLLMCLAQARKKLELHTSWLNGDHSLKHLDQDILNACFHNEWVQLPLHWNAQGLGSYAKDRVSDIKEGLFTQEEFLSLSVNPSIVHFTGGIIVQPAMLVDRFVVHPSKPTAFLCQHPFVREFFQVLDDSPWKGWRPNQMQSVEASILELQEFCQKAKEVDDSFCIQLFWRQLLNALECEINK